MTVDGYVGNTDLHRSNRNDIAITVNGRWVQDSNLAWAVEKGYANALPMGRRPMAVIHLTCAQPPGGRKRTSHQASWTLRII